MEGKQGYFHFRASEQVSSLIYKIWVGRLSWSERLLSDQGAVHSSWFYLLKRLHLAAEDESAALRSAPRLPAQGSRILSFSVMQNGAGPSMTKSTCLCVWQGDPAGTEKIQQLGGRIRLAGYYDKSPSKWKYACNILQCWMGALWPRMIPPTSSIICFRKWHFLPECTAE